MAKLRALRACINRMAWPPKATLYLFTLLIGPREHLSGKLPGGNIVEGRMVPKLRRKNHGLRGRFQRAHHATHHKARPNNTSLFPGQLASTTSSLARGSMCPSNAQNGSYNSSSVDTSFVVLLTMTIDVGNTAYTEQSSVQERIKTYNQSLKQWGLLPYEVYIIESSGYGNPYEAILRPEMHYRSIKLPHKPERGKGYGESFAIEYALENMIPPEEKWICKFTARWAPLSPLFSISKIMERANPPDLITSTADARSSRWMLASRNFWAALVKRCKGSCNDDPGRSARCRKKRCKPKWIERHRLRFEDAVQVCFFSRRA